MGYWLLVIEGLKFRVNMKRFILTICMLVVVAGAFAQRDYYIGVPLHETNMKDSARIVLDMLPWNLNGRLDAGKMPRYMEPLKHFLIEHPGFKCNIHLYGVESNEEKNLAFTTYQAKRLGEYFTYEDTLFDRNYLNGIIPHGTYNPLFKDVQPDSSNRIYKGRAAFYLRECVIVELIQPKPLHKMVQKSVFTSHPVDTVDREPSFPGGSAAFFKFLYDRIDYSVVGQSNVVGAVVVEFDIDAFGQVNNPKLTRSLFPALDEQALRLVNEMPRWVPATKNGHPVNCRYQLILYYGLF